MSNEFAHKDAGAKLTRVEDNALDRHEADGQTANDMLYFNGTYWIRATPASIATILESSIESAIDTLANLTSVQGHTFTLTGNLIRSGTHSLTLTTTATTSLTLPAGTETLVGKASTDTLTNKTLTTPIIATLYQDAGKTKLLTMPAATDTLVGKTTTDTLTNKTLTTPILSAGGITDADADTKIDVEESADEDKIRMDVEGTEAFLLDDVGILDLAKQSRAKAYLNGAAQTIPDSTYAKVILDAEAYDEQNEFNSVLSTGTATATTGDKLVDSNATFEADGIIVGAVVWNTTDNTKALVTAIDSETTLSIDTDIMADGEGYKVANARFTATKAGYYAIVGSTMFLTVAADQQYMVLIYKNGAVLCSNRGHSSLVAHLGLQTTVITDLAATDYIELFVYHTAGAVKNVHNTETTTFLSVHKLS